MSIISAALTSAYVFRPEAGKESCKYRCLGQEGYEEFSLNDSNKREKTTIGNVCEPSLIRVRKSALEEQGRHASNLGSGWEREEI